MNSERSWRLLVYSLVVVALIAFTNVLAVEWENQVCIAILGEASCESGGDSYCYYLYTLGNCGGACGHCTGSENDALPNFVCADHEGGTCTGDGNDINPCPNGLREVGDCEKPEPEDGNCYCVNLTIPEENNCDIAATQVCATN